MPTIIHRDQAGFIPVRNTALNIRRLLQVLEADSYSKDTADVFAVDIEKAFDSLEWPYLFHVMAGFGLGDTFIAWTALLYRFSTARVRMGGVII